MELTFGKERGGTRKLQAEKKINFPFKRGQNQPTQHNISCVRIHFI